MIHLFFGEDDYRVRGAVRELCDRIAASDDMLQSNTTVLDGRETSPQELLSHATAVPFLASNRLVIVEGLLRALGEIKGGRRKKVKDDDPMAPWRDVIVTLGDKAAVPETTTLVFVEGELTKTNVAFSMIAPIARAVEFAALGKNELAPWIDAEAKRRGVKLAPRAITALAQLIGPDLWMLSNELEKLGAYAAGEIVEQETVAELVSAARESRIWDLTDAVVAGDERKALAALSRLLVEGQAAPILAFMVVRQFRQIVLVKDLRERRLRQDEVARQSGVPGFRVEAVGALASRYSWPTLRAAYALLLEADLSVKRGLQDDESSLQLMVHELCALAPRASGRRAHSR
ncbi:MAG: DNA polymerase III subunit delta [Dehalococcoidia bacterium]